MTKLEQVKLLLDFYFAPWGVAKGQIWEDISGGQPFEDAGVLWLLEGIIYGNVVFSESDVKLMRIVLNEP